MASGSVALFVFIVGGGFIVGAGWWLFRKLFGRQRSDPTAPKAKDTWDSREGPPGM